MILVKKIFKLPHLLILIILIVSIPAFLSLAKPGYFPMHDDVQAIRLLEIDKCVKDGQIPCRWVPDMGFGYGYPEFNYYAPNAYYVMEIFHLSGFGYLDSVKAVFILSIIVSIVSMWLLARSLWGERGALISTLLYVYAPYRAVDMYVRGAVAEFWAMGFIPLAFWSAREVILGKRLGVILLALSLAAILTSHNITSLIFLPFLGFWIIYLSFEAKRYLTPNFKKRIAAEFLGLFWGFLASAYYILPALFEEKFVHIETLLGGYFNYLAHFVGIKQLLFSNFWGYGFSVAGPYDDIFLGVGLLHWIIPIVVVATLILLKRRKELTLVLFFVIAGWISLFFIHPRSVFIWNHIKILSYLQFPWRFLVLAVFFFSVASGALGKLLDKGKTLFFLTGFLLFFLITIFYMSFFRPSAWLAVTDKQKFSGEAWQKQQTVSIFDYLPIYAKYPPEEEAKDKPIVVGGKAEILSGKKGTDWQQWVVDVQSDTALIRLQIFYFPGWKILIDGKGVNVDYNGINNNTVSSLAYNDDLGLINVILQSGRHDLAARLYDTPIRKIGNLATIIAIIFIPLYLIKLKRV